MTKRIDYIFNLILSTMWIRPTWCEMSELNICHDDFNLNPPDGVLKEHTFPWLGFVQHLHEVTGLLHPNRAPRVVLVHNLFVLTMASDVLNLPKSYKLGNVVFGEYEREEKDCGLTSQDILMGYKCPRAYIEMPLDDILPHPEFSRFGVNNSLALVKLIRPMKSCKQPFPGYMIPLCLPTLEERMKKKKLNTVFLIDYISSVPRDFTFERMGKRTLKLFTHKECSRTLSHNMVPTTQILSQILCTSGCGMRPGAPIITHTVDGRFELMGMAVGGPPCSDRSMRRRFNENPPLYIDVYPYVAWIINVITAHTFPKSYPQNFRLVQGGYHMSTVRSSQKTHKSGWKGRTFLWGERCFLNARRRKKDLLFYKETFSLRANVFKVPSELNIILKISSGIECQVACVRVLLPHRLFQPKIKMNDIDITLSMEAITFTQHFSFSLGISGRNVTRPTFVRRKELINNRVLF